LAARWARAWEEEEAEVDRRNVLATLAAGLMTTGQAFAAAFPMQEIAQYTGADHDRYHRPALLRLRSAFLE
jgi:hypothetical protein